RGLARSLARQCARERHGLRRGKGDVAGGIGERRPVSAGAALQGVASPHQSRAAFPSGPRNRARAAHRSRIEEAEGDGRLTNGGLVLVAKPAGPTSHDVVDIVRRALGEERVGHLGTLDPFAKGLLVLVVGRATRLAPFAAEWPKTYEGVIRLGISTDTHHLTGARVGPPPLAGPS